jgi:hypothetical protein
MSLLHYLLPLGIWMPLSAIANHFSSGNDDRQVFIENYAEIAVSEMQRSGIPASITLAQAILESGAGTGSLAVNARNFFGIKCHNTWTGETFYMWDDDPQQSCFRVYGSAEESFHDHSEFLMANLRYKPLFDHHNTDYRNWAAGLKSCGYATDTAYAEKVIRIIEENGLFVYDHACTAAPARVLNTSTDAGFDIIAPKEEVMPEEDELDEEEIARMELTEEADINEENMPVEAATDILDAPIYRLDAESKTSPGSSRPEIPAKRKSLIIIPLPDFEPENR